MAARSRPIRGTGHGAGLVVPTQDFLAPVFTRPPSTRACQQRRRRGRRSRKGYKVRAFRRAPAERVTADTMVFVFLTAIVEAELRSILAQEKQQRQMLEAELVECKRQMRDQGLL